MFFFARSPVLPPMSSLKFAPNSPAASAKFGTSPNWMSARCLAAFKLAASCAPSAPRSAAVCAKFGSKYGDQSFEFCAPCTVCPYTLPTFCPVYPLAGENMVVPPGDHWAP